MDRLDAMQAFVTVAELNGFAPAARRLKLSASSVTRLVAALEDQVGARLLQRTTRAVALTEVGRQYLERARRILADIAEAEAAARAERSRPSGRLVVSAPLMFGRLHVNPLMSEFLRRYPEVSGELQLTDRVVNLIDDGVDVAVRIGELPDSSVVARLVGDMDRVVVAAPDYLARRGTPAHPSELQNHDVIHCSSTQPANEWRFGAGDRALKAPIAPRYVTNSAEAGLWHAEQGGGLTMVLYYQAADAIAQGRLRIVLEDFEPPPRPIHIVYPAARLLSAKVRAFTDLAVELCEWRFTGIRGGRS